MLMGITTEGWGMLTAAPLRRIQYHTSTQDIAEPSIPCGSMTYLRAAPRSNSV